MEDKEAVTGQFLPNLGDLLESMTAEILREPDPQRISLWLQELSPAALRRLHRPAEPAEDSPSPAEPSR